MTHNAEVSIRGGNRHLLSSGFLAVEDGNEIRNVSRGIRPRSMLILTLSKAPSESRLGYIADNKASYSPVLSTRPASN